jgi:hypothetical protein
VRRSNPVALWSSLYLARGTLSVILAVGLSILLKIFLSEEKISLFGLGAFLLVRKGI